MMVEPAVVQEHSIMILPLGVKREETMSTLGAPSKVDRAGRASEMRCRKSIQGSAFSTSVSGPPEHCCDYCKLSVTEQVIPSTPWHISHAHEAGKCQLCQWEKGGFAGKGVE